MSVVNEPKYKNGLFQAIWEQMELLKAIAKGDGVCRIRFVRK